MANITFKKSKKNKQAYEILNGNRIIAIAKPVCGTVYVTFQGRTMSITFNSVAAAVEHFDKMINGYSCR